MKNLFVVIGLLAFAIGYTQEKEKAGFPKNEIKGNALFLVLGAVELTYEKAINDFSGVGASVFFAKEDDFETNFSFTPYYRAYFGKKPAAGFFVEGFGMLNTGKEDTYSTYDFNNQVYYTIEGEKYTDFALGFGIGAKWVHIRGFVFEINAGIGRNLISDNSPEVVGRGGITLGYRF